MADFWIKQGDSSPSYRATLRDGDGNAVDIAGADVRFLMRRQRGTLLVVDAEADIDQDVDGDDAPINIGQVHYDWQVGDTDEEGGFLVEFEVTFEGSLIETFPNDGYLTVAILEDLEADAS